MTRDSLATDARLIGMVQPRVPDLDDNRGASEADLKGERKDVYGTGCAGRITEFAESDDGRYMMTLTGLCRFELVEDMSDKDGYRRVLADYGKYRGDLGGAREATVDRDRLLAAVKGYFTLQGIGLDWESVQATPDERLVTSLAMTCPFGPNERQALLEAPGTTERADIVTAMPARPVIRSQSLDEENTHEEIPVTQTKRSVDPKLLEILVCPVTKKPLRYDEATQELISDEAKLAYPIRDGIPIMLADEARPLEGD
jgi:hypothetical protein